MNKCGNRADPSPFKGHKWVVDGVVYCSPWCQRNKGQHPNSVGLYKKIGLRPAPKMFDTTAKT